jgi:hypothetical protein
MKRFQFLAAFLGLGAAANGQKKDTSLFTVPGMPGTGDCIGADDHGYKRIECPSQFLSKNPKLLLNGQCPVCGTMAPPVYDELLKVSCLNRCAVCNAAFWLEKEK